jgi:hypothetical protein
LSDPVTPGQSCSSPAGQVGSTSVTSAATTVLRAIAGGGLAICDPASGTWSAIARTATAGAACSGNGITALSSAGVMLICTNSVWTPLTDRMGYMVAAETWRVSDAGSVAKPACAPGSTGSRLLATPATNSRKNNSLTVMSSIMERHGRFEWSTAMARRSAAICWSYRIAPIEAPGLCIHSSTGGHS